MFSGRLVSNFNEVIVTAVLRQAGRALLCRRHPDRDRFPNLWSLPGGHAYRGEGLSAALERELSEELGVVLGKPLGSPSRHFALSGDVQMLIWLIDYEGDVFNRAPDEHDELRWVTLAEICHLDLAHEEYLDVLGEALDGSPR